MPTVLLVEDDPDNCYLMQVWLTVMGHTVLTAVSAVEALKLLDEHGVPDIAIIDIVMEEITGLDLLDHLRRHESLTARMPAILLTAREMDTDFADAWALDAALMKKPLEKANLAAAIKRALQRPAPEVDGSQSGVILLIDDDKDDVYLTRYAFEQNNISNEIVVACDGIEALAMLLPDDGSQPLRPAIVLLDLHMPRMGGLQVLARLRADPSTRSLPVIMLTGPLQDRDIAEIYNLGANSYVPKPVTAHEFFQAAKTMGVYWLAAEQQPATS